jgi:Family of unknown function (DUF6214)
VPLGDGYAAPRHFIAESDTVRLEIEVDEAGSGHCRAVAIRAREGESLTSESVRIPLSGLVKQAVASAAAPVEAGTVEGLDVLQAILTTPRQEAQEFYERYTKNARRPRRGSPFTEENLRQVADLYRAALERGDPPTQTVADELNVPRSTAARWVGKARDRNLLGPALRGRGGEGKETG